MKKSEIREFFRDMRASVSVVARERPTMLPVVTGAALLESAFPFVNIVFSAWILDRLQAGGTGVMDLVYWMVGLNLAIGLGSKLLRRYCQEELWAANAMVDRAIVKKCLTMDYQQLEDQEKIGRAHV